MMILSLMVLMMITLMRMQLIRMNWILEDLTVSIGGMLYPVIPEKLFKTTLKASA